MSHIRIYYFLKIRAMTDTVALHEISKLILKSLFFALTLKEFYMFTSVSLSFRLCGRRGGWDVSREQHRNMYTIKGETDHQPRLDA